MAISSILKQISYSFNINFLLANFAFVKKKKERKLKKGARWHKPPTPLDLPLRISLEEKVIVFWKGTTKDNFMFLIKH